MGRVVKVLSFKRFVRNGVNVSDVKADRGGSDTRTLEHFSAPGDDSQPLPGDYAAALPQAGTGRDSAVGYVDPVNEPKSGPGEKRVYARDPDTGAVVGEVWLKNDGGVVLVNDKAALTLSAAGGIKGENAAGEYELTPAGRFLINGVDFGLHTHPQAPDSDSDTQQPTGPPTP